MKADTLFVIQRLQRAAQFHSVAGRKDLADLCVAKVDYLFELDRMINNCDVKARVPRSLVPLPKHSKWGLIRASRIDAAYIDFLGISRRGFYNLARECKPWLSERVRGGAGRRFLLDYVDIVAVVLHFLHCTSQQKDMNYSFGVTQTQFREALERGFPAVHVGLREIPASWVYWPTAEMREKYHADLAARSSGGGMRMPSDIKLKVYGWIDGTFFATPDPANSSQQRSMYSGKSKTCGVNNVFVFAPDGTIIWYNINQPGTSHDWPMCRRLIMDFLHDDALNPEGWGLLGDVGFRTKDTDDIFLTLPGSREKGNTMSKAASQWITRKRQAVEWGIKDFKRIFPRLSLGLPSNSAVRRMMLETCVFLYNYRLRFDMGNSQIASVYKAAAKRDEENARYCAELPGLATAAQSLA